MKKASAYILSLIFTLLLTFVCIAACAAGVFRFCALNTDTALKLVGSQDLAAKVHSALETDFRQQESTSGIPASLYAPYISAEQLEPVIRDSVANGFAYLRGDTASLGVSPDFSALETDIRRFFSDYAAEKNIEKNETYESAVKSTIDNAESKILSACDVFRFATLNETGMIGQVRPYLPWAGAGAIGLIAAAALLILILFAVNHSEPEHGLYFTGIALAISSVLLMIPAVWLEKTRWFDRFAVKTDHTFAAVTGFLYANTHAVIRTACIALAAGLLMFLLFGILHGLRCRRESVRDAKH